MTARDLEGTALLLAASEAPCLVREILNEFKTNGIGNDKNVLIELNIKQTRHNDIQLLAAIATAKADGKAAEVKALENGLKVLRYMK